VTEITDVSEELGASLVTRRNDKNYWCFRGTCCLLSTVSKCSKLLTFRKNLLSPQYHVETVKITDVSEELGAFLVPCRNDKNYWRFEETCCILNTVSKCS